MLFGMLFCCHEGGFFVSYEIDIHAYISDPAAVAPMNVGACPIKTIGYRMKMN